MFLDINQFRAAIGLFNSIKLNKSKFKGLGFQATHTCQTFLMKWALIFLAFFTFYFNFSCLAILCKASNNCHFAIFELFFFEIFNLHFARIFLLLSVDIHSNPGPKDRCNFSILYWNLNSISVNNFSKLSSLEAYNSVYKYDLICLGETYLDSSFSIDDSNLILNGYNLVRADHPLDVRRGGVCIYYKESLPLRVLNVCPLSECLLIEVLYGKKNVLLLHYIDLLVKIMKNLTPF